jgi:hypothetical protein
VRPNRAAIIAYDGAIEHRQAQLKQIPCNQQYRAEDWHTARVRISTNFLQRVTEWNKPMVATGTVC